MKSHRIYVPEPLADLRHVDLSGSQAGHIQRVLRLAAGDMIILFDGSGGEFAAEILSVSRGLVRLALKKHCQVSRESGLKLVLIQGVSQGPRMDLTVQKATELGVNRIVPIVTERSVARPSGKRAGNRRRHWLSVAASACEQCGRNLLPDIDEPSSLEGVLADKPAADGYYVLTEDNSKAAIDFKFEGTSLCYLVGPEGGLTRLETAAASTAGFEPVCMGPRTLRTETAAIAFAAIAQSLWGDMGRLRLKTEE